MTIRTPDAWLPSSAPGCPRLPAGAGFVDGWFAAGDLACCYSVGCVTVVGRSRDLIISGGETIHSAESENLAAAWLGMAKSPVLGLPDRRCGEVPVLARVAQTGVEIDLAALRAHLALRLGRFKQPRRIVLLAALPRTALGAVQKAALRQAALRQALLRQALLDADNFLSPVD